MRRAEALKSAPPVKPAPIVVKKEETLTKPTTSRLFCICVGFPLYKILCIVPCLLFQAR